MVWKEDISNNAWQNRDEKNDLIPAEGLSKTTALPINVEIKSAYTLPFSDPRCGISLGRLQDGTFVAVKVLSVELESIREYAISGHLTRKPDVYSFGVLLLEIVSGCPVIAFDIERGEHFLVNKAWEMYNNGKLLELVNGEFCGDETVRFLKIGLLCVQEIASLRPKMSTVIKMLSSNMEEGINITQPGILADLKDVKIGQKQSSRSFFSSV
ncbi:hypothetical protein RND71_003994 [Anisodus tanguticus]|uniref:Uncharacterized protein n=1 Tax=Anisodus tanguticus TaxID=243964 RepID=A0AAE1SUA1_9SOLA|nr:hypothetical protein RND71_003994 [Anisodus tanguticus]